MELEQHKDPEEENQARDSEHSSPLEEQVANQKQKAPLEPPRPGQYTSAPRKEDSLLTELNALSAKDREQWENLYVKLGDEQRAWAEFNQQKAQIQQTSAVELAEAEKSLITTPSTPQESNQQPVADSLVGSLYAGRSLDELLGEGGYKTVYKATREEIVTALAIPHKPERDTIRKEVRLLDTLKHVPGVVKLRDFSVEEETAFIETEYIQGTLSAWLERDTPLTEKIEVFTTYLHALAGVHREGIVHGDLKPSNLLIDAQQQAIGDFGTARREGDMVEQKKTSLEVSRTLTTLASNQGEGHTIHYYPLDVVLGKAPATPSADVFAMGKIFYQMLTGELSEGTVEKKLKAKGVPDQITNAISKAVDQEYTNAQEMLEDLVVKAPVKVESAESSGLMAKLASLWRRLTDQPKQKDWYVQERNKGDRLIIRGNVAYTSKGKILAQEVKGNVHFVDLAKEAEQIKKDESYGKLFTDKMELPKEPEYFDDNDIEVEGKYLIVTVGESSKKCKPKEGHKFFACDKGGPVIPTDYTMVVGGEVEELAFSFIINSYDPDHAQEQGAGQHTILLNDGRKLETIKTVGIYQDHCDKIRFYHNALPTYNALSIELYNFLGLADGFILYTLDWVEGGNRIIQEKMLDKQGHSTTLKEKIIEIENSTDDWDPDEWHYSSNRIDSLFGGMNNHTFTSYPREKQVITEVVTKKVEKGKQIEDRVLYSNGFEKCAIEEELKVFDGYNDQGALYSVDRVLFNGEEKVLETEGVWTVVFGYAQGWIVNDGQGNHYDTSTKERVEIASSFEGLYVQRKDGTIDFMDEKGRVATVVTLQHIKGMGEHPKTQQFYARTAEGIKVEGAFFALAQAEKVYFHWGGQKPIRINTSGTYQVGNITIEDKKFAQLAEAAIEQSLPIFSYTKRMKPEVVEFLK